MNESGWRLLDGVRPEQGVLQHTQPLFSVPSVGRPFVFAITYRSGSQAASLESTGFDGPLGLNWNHSFSWPLSVITTTGDVRIITPDLGVLDFTKSGANYAPSSFAHSYKLTTNTTGFVLTDTDKNLTYQYGTYNLLFRITDRNNNMESIYWDKPTTSVSAPWLTTSIFDTSGQQYAFAWQYDEPSGHGEGWTYADATVWRIRSITQVSTGRTMLVTHFANHFPTAVRDSATGGTITYGYVSDSEMLEHPALLTSIANEEGQLTLEVTYDVSQRVIETVDHSVISTYTYDADLHETTRTVSRNGISGNQVLSTKKVRVDSELRTTRIEDSGGNVFTYSYTNDGNVEEYVDGESQTWSMGWSAGRMTSLQRGGQTQSLTYSDDGDLTSVTDSGGHTTTYELDVHGNTTAIVDAVGRREFTRNSRGQILTASNPRGHTTTYTYTNYLLTQIDRPLNFTQTFSYGSDRLLNLSVAANGARTTYVHDDAGRITQVIDHLGGTNNFTWLKTHGISTVSDKRGNVTTYYASLQSGEQPGMISMPLEDLIPVYDGMNNIAKNGEFPPLLHSFDGMRRTTGITDGLGNKELFAYDGNSRLTASTDREGGVTRYTYDTTGNVTSVTHADLTTEHFEYNSDNLLMASVAAGGGRTTYAYDELHRKIRQTDPLGRVTLWEYDANGNKTKETLPGNQDWNFEYDALDRLTKITDPLDGETTLEYDCACDKPTAMQIPSGSRWTYTYDALGHKTSETAPGDHVWEWTYDADGRVLTETDPTNAETAYAYDQNGRLTSITYPGSKTTSISYHAGRFRSIEEDARTKITNSWDAAGRLSNVEAKDHRAIGTGATIYYTRNKNGAKTKVSTTNPQFFGGDYVSYLRDARDRVILISEAYSGNTYNTSVTYTTDGLPATIVRPNGVTTTNTYTAALEIGSITHTVTSSTVEQFSFSRDSTGNISSKGTLAGTISYGYDSLHRLVATTGPVEAERFQYDAASNITVHESSITGTVTHTYDSGNRIASTTTGSVTTTYTHNDRGDITQMSDGTTTGAFPFSCSPLFRN